MQFKFVNASGLQNVKYGAENVDILLLYFNLHSWEFTECLHILSHIFQRKQISNILCYATNRISKNAR